jgi:hypothetical protein
VLTTPTEDKTFIDLVPPSTRVRERLAQAMRETDILRKLLKVATDAEREREMRKGAAHVAG